MSGRRHESGSQRIRRTAPLLIGAVLFALLGRPADALAQSERLGLGGLTGSPSGVTIKLYLSRDRAIDAVGSWSLGRANPTSRLYFHSLRERPIDGSPLNFFRGPGLVLGTNSEGDESRFVMGISGLFGLNFFVERFEVFLHAMPRLEMDPDLRGYLGGSAGLRYYF